MRRFNNYDEIFFHFLNKKCSDKTFLPYKKGIGFFLFYQFRPTIALISRRWFCPFQCYSINKQNWPALFEKNILRNKTKNRHFLRIKSTANCLAGFYINFCKQVFFKKKTIFSAVDVMQVHKSVQFKNDSINLIFFPHFFTSAICENRHIAMHMPVFRLKAAANFIVFFVLFFSII